MYYSFFLYLASLVMKTDHSFKISYIHTPEDPFSDGTQPKSYLERADFAVSQATVVKC